MENLKEKAVKSVFWVGLARTISQAVSWSVTILLVRILSPEDYGLMGMALAYKLIVTIIYDLSIGEAVLQKEQLTEDDINTAFWICFSSAVALYTVTWFAAKGWAYFFSNDELVKIIRVLGLSFILLSINEIPYRLMARDFEFKKRSAFEVASGFISLLTMLAMAVKGYGVWSLVFGDIVKHLALVCFVLFYLKWTPKFGFSLSSANQLLKYGFPITGHYILNYLSNKGDSIVIGKILGQSVLGYYTVALNLSRMPIDKGVFIIQRVMFPLFSQIQNDTSECVNYYHKIVYFISIFSFPVLFGMFAISEEIIVLILSPKWMPALIPFKIFCLLGILQSYTGVFLVILKARGNTGAVFKYSVYSAIFLPIGFLVFSSFGLIGVAFSWLFVFPPLFGYLFYNVASDIGASIKESFKRVAPALIGSLLMLMAIAALKATIFKNTISFGSLFVNIIIGATLYIGYFYFFSRKTFQDIRNIFDTLRA